MSKTIPARKDVPAKDKWDLSSIFKSDSDWETALKGLPQLTKKAAAFKGKLSEEPETLLSALKAYQDALLSMECIYHYASLQHEADEDDTTTTDRYGRAMMAYTQQETELSFIDPEIQSIDEKLLREWISRPDFADYRIYIEKFLYLKKYILSEKEERILSLQGQPAQTAETAFSVLTNVDLNKTFGTVMLDGEEQQLTETTWGVFMHNQDRKVREQAYKKFYAKFEEHQNTIAALYAGSVNQDVFTARARGYDSSLHAALYGNKVPLSVYHNLIDCIHKNLDALHKYYGIRKRALGLDELRHWDVYVPLVKSVQTKTTYEESVEICRNALAPLGKEYTDRLCNGLLSGWVDRYENIGKRSGAFSSGSYIGYPYILLNYNEENIRDVFTMAHEGGHSMHSWYSVHNNPYMSYDYTIFEAEVASTFNEELVFEYLLEQAKRDNNADLQKYLLAMRADDILATLYRQTMFAEFELKAHELVEGGTPLTPELLRKIYRELLELYFGPEMKFESNSDMEGLRIPHFYSAFYVYKYATGLISALAISTKILNGEKDAVNNYLNFLKSGSTKPPVELLKSAGADLTDEKTFKNAFEFIGQVLDEWDNLMTVQENTK